VAAAGEATLDRVVTALRVWTHHPLFLPVLIVLTVALVLPSARAALHGDDYIILGILSGSALSEIYPSRLDVFNFVDGSPERTRRMLDLGLLPWWTFPDVRVAFWRPVSALSHGVDYALWRDTPALMHAHSLLWLGALIAAALFMYRRLMGPGVAAGLAALLYALDRTHVFPATDISGRNTILAALFGTLTLLFHDRWRRAGWPAGSVLAPACFALALLSAEGAVAVLGYLLAHAVFLERAGWRGRLYALLPYGLLTAGWHLVRQGLGYGVVATSPNIVDPMREPLQFARTVAKNGPAMLQALWTGPSAETLASLPPEAALIRWGAALATMAALAILLMPWLRRDAVARFWALGQALAVVPVCAAGAHDRYLLVVGLGAMGLMARAVWGLLSREPCRPRRRLWRWTAGLVAGALMGIHLIVWPLEVVRTAVDRGGMPQAADTIPIDPAMRRELVVIVNAPHAVSVFHWFFVRTVRAQPIPGQTRVLASTPAPLTIDRLDPHTLRVRWEGRQEPIFRPPHEPLVVGQRVRLAGTDIEVTAVSDDGWPAEALFRFDRDLDGPAVRWLRWERGQDRYVGFRPPAVGQRARVH
jgi:hypothetical protein